MINNLDRMFVTSDYHFGSWRLLSPFAVFTKDEEIELISKWNSVIKKNDIVFYNGDFSDCSIKQTYEYLSQLNGKITLIKGNHDRFDDETFKEMFVSVVEEMYIPDLDLVIHHCPEEDCGSYEIYGHLHRNDIFNPISKRNSFCSCVQRNNGYPVSLKYALDIMSKGG